MLKNLLITLLFSLSFFAFCNPREIAINAVGTGVSYSGMYLLYKEKHRAVERIEGALLLIAGVIVILNSEWIIAEYDTLTGRRGWF